MAWTRVEDIEARWVSTDEHKASVATIQAWIDDAEEVVLFEFPTIQDRIDDEDDPLTERRVRLVVCSMVLRVLRNPANHRAQATGPFSVTFAGDTPGGIWMTDDERKMLAVYSGEASGAFSVDTVSDGTIVHADICSINFGATYCSCGAVLTGAFPLYETDGS